MSYGEAQIVTTAKTRRDKFHSPINDSNCFHGTKRNKSPKRIKIERLLCNKTTLIFTHLPGEMGLTRLAKFLATTCQIGRFLEVLYLYEWFEFSARMGTLLLPGRFKK